MDKIREVICRGIVYSDRDAVYGTQRPAGGGGTCKKAIINANMRTFCTYCTKHASLLHR